MISPRPDKPWRTALLLVVLPLALLLSAGAGGWAYVRQRAETRDAREAEELATLFFFNAAQSPADFERVLALCDSPDPKARSWAVAGAWFAAKQDPDARNPRATAAADRLLDDPSSEVRVRAIVALGNLGARDRRDRVRPFLQSDDTEELRVAVQTVKQLEAGASAE
jgi:HEAT repeat protein